jgi:methylated-DNA-[protein]-cysteine S-methyltransferase
MSLGGVDESQLTFDVYVSPVGALTIVASQDGLVVVGWPCDTPRRVPVLGLLGAQPVQRGRNAVIDETCRQLGEFFRGARRSFDVPLQPRGTEFQHEVWGALALIGYGETTTYSALAEQLGRPTSVRAVASAIGRNPLSIVVPCHRVVGKDGTLSGFAGGLEAKRRLLDLEAENAGRRRSR